MLIRVVAKMPNKISSSTHQLSANWITNPLAQLATEASIRIGPYTLTFELAQRNAQDPRNTKLSPAIAELKSRSGKLHSEPSLALYDFKLQLLDDYLILPNQS